MSLSYLRSFRIKKFAVVDFIASLVFAYIVAPYIHISRLAGMLLIIPAGVLLHSLTNQNTPLNMMVFGTGNYHVKIIMVALTVSGLLLVKN